MHVSGDFLGILFAGTVFLLLAYKLYELVKEYCVPYLSQEVQNFRKKQTELLEKNELIRSTLQRVETRLGHQKKMFVVLERKVKMWNAYQLDKQKQIFDDHVRIQDELLEKRKQQLFNFSRAKKSFEALPQAVSSAHDELRAVYAGPKGVALLQSYVQKLQSNDYNQN